MLPHKFSTFWKICMGILSVLVPKNGWLASQLGSWPSPCEPRISISISISILYIYIYIKYQKITDAGSRTIRAIVAHMTWPIPSMPFVYSVHCPLISHCLQWVLVMKMDKWRWKMGIYPTDIPNIHTHFSSSVYWRFADENRWCSISSIIFGWQSADFCWLVVLTILKNTSQWEGLSRILWKIKK